MVIFSNDVSNKYLQRFQVVPLSTAVQKLYPTETFVQIGTQASKAMADQLTTVSELRCIEKIGNVTPLEMAAIEDIIRLQLGLK